VEQKQEYADRCHRVETMRSDESVFGGQQQRGADGRKEWKD